MDKPYLLLVLTGKTASGKDTIQAQLLSKYPNLKGIVTTTSRAPRDGERDGVDYHFITRDEFEKKIESGEFAEYVEYGGNLYGTYKSELESALTQDTLWRIDPSRAGEVREFIKRAFPSEISEKLIKRLLVIYVTVADDVVLQRLKERNLSTQEIEKRIKDDEQIWQKNKDNYDHVIENVPGKLDQTIAEITNIIKSHKRSYLL